MKRAVAAALRKVVIEEIPDPAPGSGEIFVRAKLSGVSAGTEMAVYKGTICNMHTGRWGYWTEYPILPGYELVGVVEGIGGEVTEFAVGDRVLALHPHATCACVSAGKCIRIPDTVPDEDATFAILGATTTHGIQRAQVGYGDRVLVLGFGVVGFLSSLHARRAGVDQVIVADPLKRKRELAIEKGFDQPLDPLHGDFEKEVLDLTEGMGFDVVIEASGHPSSIDPAFAAVKLGGRILIQGTHTAPVPIVFSDYVMHKEITIIGTWKGGPDLPSDPQYVRWNGRKNTQLAMRLIESGQLPVQDSVTHRIPFEELPGLYPKIENRELEFLQIILEY